MSDLLAKYMAYSDTFDDRKQESLNRAENKGDPKSPEKQEDRALGLPVHVIERGSNTHRVLQIKDPRGGFAAWGTFHFQGKGPGQPGLMYMCHRTFGLPCPKCDERQAHWESIYYTEDPKDVKKANFEKWKQTSHYDEVNPATVYFSLSFKNSIFTPENLGVLRYKKMIFRALDEIYHKRNGGDFTNPFTGFPVDILKKGEGRYDTSYEVDYSSNDTSPLGTGLQHPALLQARQHPLGSRQWYEYLFNEAPGIFQKVESILERVPDLRNFITQEYHWCADDGMLYTYSQLEAIKQGASAREFREQNRKEYQETGRVVDRPIVPQRTFHHAQGDHVQDSYSTMTRGQLEAVSQQRGYPTDGRQSSQGYRQELRQQDTHRPPTPPRPPAPPRPPSRGSWDDRSAQGNYNPNEDSDVPY